MTNTVCPKGECICESPLPNMMQADVVKWVNLSAGLVPWTIVTQGRLTKLSSGAWHKTAALSLMLCLVTWTKILRFSIKL